MDVVEVYSPPYVVQFVEEFCLASGWSFDPITIDERSRCLDFSPQGTHDKASAKVKRDQPLLAIRSPMRTNFASIMNLNWVELGKIEGEEGMADARAHRDFCVKFRRMQHENRRHRLHEHFLSAASWREFGIMLLGGMEWGHQDQGPHV